MQPTLLKYYDRDSRLAVLASLRVIGNSNPTSLFESISSILGEEIEKFHPKSTQTLESVPGARSYRFSLLIWVNLALDFLFKASENDPKKFSKTALNLIDYQARLLWGLGLTLEPKSSNSKSKTLFFSALADTRRVIRKNSAVIPFYLTTLTSFTFSKHVYSNVLLGNVISTSLRLKNTDFGVSCVEQNLAKIISFIDENLFSLKVNHSYFSIASFDDFINKYVDANTFSTRFQPTINKMLLRQPENVITCLVLFFKYASFDSAELLATHYSEKLANLILKSTSSQVLEKCVSLFNILAEKCVDSTNTIASANAIFSVLSKNKTASFDSKAVLLNLLKAFTKGSLDNSDSSEAICKLILEHCPKETQEQTISAYLDTLGYHFKVILSASLSGKNYSDIIKKVISASSEGVKLSGRMAGVRKSWIVSVIAFSVWGFTSSDLKSQTFSDFSKLSLELFPIIEKVQSNLLGSGYEPIEAFACLSTLSSFFQALPKEKQDYLINQIFSSTSKHSFLYALRFYNKIVSTNEVFWLSNSLLSSYSIIQNLINSESPDHSNVGHNCDTFKPLLWAFVNHKNIESHKIIFKSLQEMTNISISPFIEFIPSDLTSIMDDHFCNSYADSDLLITPYEWYNLLVSTLPIPTEGVQPVSTSTYLLSIILPAHHPVITLKSFDRYTFASIVQRCKIDVKVLLSQNLESLNSLIISTFADFGISHPKSMASKELVKTVSLVLEDSFVISSFETSSKLLALSDVESITADDKIIWATPSTELAFDPLLAKISSSNKSGGKDKWENDIRNDVNRKRLESRRLTKDEQAQVDQQKAIEEGVRARITRSMNCLLGALAILSSCVDGNIEASRKNSTGILDVILNKVLGLRNASWLLGTSVGDTLISIFKIASGINSSLHSSLAIATLRSHGFNDACPKAWLQEPIENLISRILFKIRLAVDSDFDAADFSSVFPILSATIRAGGYGIKSDAPTRIDENDEYSVLDQPTEQLLMASEIILLSSNKAASPAFPRADFFKANLYIMSNYNDLFSKARDAMSEASNALENIDGLVLERRVVLKGLLEKDSLIRFSCLEALVNFSFDDLNGDLDRDLVDDLTILWITIFDNDDTNSELARKLWDEYGLSPSFDIVKHLVSSSSGFLSHPIQPVRENSSKSIYYCISELNLLQSDGEESENNLVLNGQCQEIVDYSCNELIDRYREWYISLDPEYDQYGIVIPGTVNKSDPFEARVSVAWSLKWLSPLLYSGTLAETVISFLLTSEALGDRNDEVREAMLEAGVELISNHGHKNLEELSNLFESWLANPKYTSESHDRMRESVIVLLGTLAGHLDSGDPRIPGVLKNLAASLHTPSESVQSAVSICLATLSKKLEEEEIEKLINHLLIELFNDKKYAVRRGAAFGLAGVVKGVGLSSLRKYNIIDKIKKSASDKKNANSRQGSLFVLETLSSTLGRIFEPYMIQVLPIMLSLFGDTNSDVRDAASDASKAIMSKLSGYGVKLVLPSLLSGLQNSQWRTKKGSIEMLGSMAFCAPKQLSAALPSIIPRLVLTLSDSHINVSEAAHTALKSFGGVITNPEIIKLVPALLSALIDPIKNTNAALIQLLETPFVHYIDAPSLALIAPVLERGMKERKTTTKRHAAQVFGSMALLSEPSDLVMYIPKMLPLLKSILSDPLPETRGTSAKALGQLVSRLGEDRFDSIVEELLETIKENPVAIDRAGAAQALSEVLHGIGIEKLDGLMPRILEGCNSESAKIRDGFMLLILYLPSTFSDDFIVYLSKVISPVLKSLADENETTRNTALRVSQTLVAFYYSTASDRLVDEFLIGLRDENWRIRRASVELIGDLLLRIAGKSSKAQDSEEQEDSGSDDEDDEDGTFKNNKNKEEDYENEISIESIRQILGETLGEEKRDYIIAALYISRNDVVNSVRQASMIVWKTLTSNTPRTVRECLEPLVSLVLEGLSSNAEEQRSTSAQTLGDMVRKLGNTVIKRVIPILESTLLKDDISESSRQGVFIGLSEILACSSSTHVEEYGNAITPLVRIGLCDSDPVVRESAANAFDSLQNVLGSRVLDNVLPYLLNALSSENTDALTRNSSNVSADSALKGLQELMSIRSNLLLPTLIPTLTVEPISEFHAHALDSLIKIAGVSSPALARRLSSILTGLFSSIYLHQQLGDVQSQAACRKAIGSIVSMSYKDENAIEIVMGLLFDAVRGSEVLNDSKSRDTESRRSRRIEGCYAVSSIYQAAGPSSTLTSGNGVGRFTGEWISILVSLLSINDKEVIESAQSALSFVCKSIQKPEITKFIGIASKAVLSASKNSSGNKIIPGFCVPKGISSLLALYTHGLLEGTGEVKKSSVAAISNLVEFTEQDYLKPSITAITGPLIRIVGDRIPSDVRSVVIQALGQLLGLLPQYLKPFLPQLQRTFVKYLSDSDSYIRTQSQNALTILIPLQPRLDPLVAELASGIKALYLSILSPNSNANESHFDSCSCMIKALISALKSDSIKTLSESSFKSIEACLISSDALSIHNRQIQSALAEALPTFLKLASMVTSSAGIEAVIRTAIAKPGESSDVVEGKMRVIISLLQGKPEVILGPDSPVGSENLVKSITVALGSNDLQTVLLGIRASSLAFQNRLFYPESDNSSKKDESKPVTLAEQLLLKLVEFVDPESSNTSFIDNDIKQAVFITLKNLFKSRLSFCENYTYKYIYRFSIAKSAFSYVRTRVFPLKLAAERCIIYVLDLANAEDKSSIDSEPTVNTKILLEYIEYVGGVDSEQGKSSNDYYRRVLSKLALKAFDENYASETESSLE
ncbi:Translational activator GCN1 [Smittium culicis]|uniref:Translational activator GCN1 n=1 Tax=Smittium culicis TaxID=133412 RepID=A0A1R1Y7K3_9FUNG|nr:Translational activator GCN1 [Smittium culicis]